jgi:hypothetical protein
MLKIQDLTPINLLEEKAKFFKDFSYNPQFKYEKDINPKDLIKFGFPKPKYLLLAKKILAKANFNQEEKIVSKERVEQEIKVFLKDHNLENQLEIVFDENFLSRTSTGNGKIKIRLPISYTEEDLKGVVSHELGTHLLRKINGQKNNIKKSKDYLKTEEGLAIINSLVLKKDKLAKFPALSYLLCDEAQNKSFAEVFSLVNKYIKDKNICWNLTLKQKRGLTDTSQKGGTTKGIIYLEGFFEVLHHLLANPKDINKIYAGKISLDEINIIKTTNNILPNFISDSFYNHLKKISKDNSI